MTTKTRRRPRHHLLHRGPSAEQRRRVADMGWFLISHKPSCDYDEVRPIPDIPTYDDAVRFFHEGHILRTDCSGSTTLCFRWAGLPDPNGQGYDGAGYTGTLYSHLRDHYTDPAAAKKGAVLIYGADPTVHATFVLEPGPDPLLFSFGGDDGPMAIRESAESVWHPGQARTFCSIDTL